MTIFPRKILIEMEYPSLALDPSELSSRRHRYIPSSIFPVYKVRELVADLLSKSFLENGEICSNSL